MTKPKVGLLLDVDGPISNPDAKQILDPNIIPALVTLLNQGMPVVFNTGRADAFVRERVLGPLLAAQPERVDRLHAVCEKGAVWLSVNDDRTLAMEVDDDIAVPRAMWDAIESLINQGFGGEMFFDYEERTMISIERNLTTSHDEYVAAQGPFLEATWQLLTEMGYGVRLRDREHPDAHGAIKYRIAPELIAVDVESVVVGKDLGASRAFQLLKRDNALPQEWRSLGDSDSDYAMARWLDEQGETVKHLDVRGVDVATVPSDFEVLRPETSVFDAAGGAYLAWLVRHLDSADVNEKAFETSGD